MGFSCENRFIVIYNIITKKKITTIKSFNSKIFYFGWNLHMLILILNILMETNILLSVQYASLLVNLTIRVFCIIIRVCYITGTLFYSYNKVFKCKSKVKTCNQNLQCYFKKSLFIWRYNQIGSFHQHSICIIIMSW